MVLVSVGAFFLIVDMVSRKKKMKEGRKLKRWEEREGASYGCGRRRTYRLQATNQRLRLTSTPWACTSHINLIPSPLLTPVPNSLLSLPRCSFYPGPSKVHANLLAWPPRCTLILGLFQSFPVTCIKLQANLPQLPLLLTTRYYHMTPSLLYGAHTGKRIWQKSSPFHCPRATNLMSLPS